MTKHHGESRTKKNEHDFVCVFSTICNCVMCHTKHFIVIDKYMVTAASNGSVQDMLRESNRSEVYCRTHLITKPL